MKPQVGDIIVENLYNDYIRINLIHSYSVKGKYYIILVILKWPKVNVEETKVFRWYEENFERWFDCVGDSVLIMRSKEK